MNDRRTPDRLGLVAEEARHLAERCDALHARVVDLVGDDVDGPDVIGTTVGPATWTAMAVRCLQHTADNLAPAAPPAIAPTPTLPPPGADR